jgi:hypothetical protein
MSQSTDRRMWSTTPKRFSAFVESLIQPFPAGASARTVQRAFKEHGIYPARDGPEFCVPAAPDVFFSYHSAQNFLEIEEIVLKTIRHASEELVRHRPDLPLEEVLQTFWDGVRLWVDFMFIDQSARDLREELEVLPQLLRNATAHFVLGTEPLMRSWCCYEISLYNQELAKTDPQFAAGLEGPRLRSFIAPSQSFYIGWENTETSEVEDKVFIAERISSTFPGAFEGFNYVMAQANSVAVLPLTEGTTWSTPAADDSLIRAAEAWYARGSASG